MVERGGLENRCALARTVGSNPTPSAKFAALMAENCRLYHLPLTYTHVFTHVRPSDSAASNTSLRGAAGPGS